MVLSKGECMEFDVRLLLALAMEIHRMPNGEAFESMEIDPVPNGDCTGCAGYQVILRCDRFVIAQDFSVKYDNLSLSCYKREKKVAEFEFRGTLGKYTREIDPSFSERDCAFLEMAFARVLELRYGQFFKCV